MSGASSVKHTTNIRLVDLLSVGDFANGGVLAALQHVTPAERAGDRLNQGVIDVPSNRRGSHFGTVGREHDFPATAPADRNRHTHGNSAGIDGGAGLSHYTALRDSGLTAHKSATKIVNPSFRSLGATGADIDPLHSNCTIRACSAGNSSSYSGSSSCSASRTSASELSPMIF